MAAQIRRAARWSGIAVSVSEPSRSSGPPWRSGTCLHWCRALSMNDACDTLLALNDSGELRVP